MNPTHYLSARPWWIYAPALDSMKASAADPVARPKAAMDETYDRAYSLPVTQLGSTACIPIHGPIHGDETYWNAMCALVFGGVGQTEIAKALKDALDDDAIDSIILDIDSPGGEALGTGELAACIRQANAVKPVTAYGSGMVCSAAYYLASAAGRIIIDPSAMVGSIGTVICFLDDKEYLKKMGLKEIEIVSSQSPHKRPDPATPAGKAAYQQIVDELSHVFIGDVARYRNVSEAKVLSDFGGGGVLIGADAVKVGMADAVGSLQSCLADIRQSRGPSLPTTRATATMTSTSGDSAVNWKQFFNFASKADPAKLDAAAAILDGEPAETEAPVVEAAAPAVAATDPAVAALQAQLTEANQKAADATRAASDAKNAETLATIEARVLAFTGGLKADSKAVPAVAEKLSTAFRASLHAEHKLPMPEGVTSLSAAIAEAVAVLPSNMAGATAIGNLPAGAVVLNQETNKTVTAEAIDALWEKHYKGRA